jgi:hypothetical protein
VRSFNMSIAIASTLAMLFLTLTSVQAASQTAKERASKRGEQPERHFHEASRYFAQNDNQSAAREIRSGAELLKREADRHDAPNKAGLQAAELELDTLAAKVEKGQVSSPNELDQCFARADVALARNSHQLAEAAIAQGNHKQAGSWLEATSGYVEDAAGWSKQKLDTGESATLHGVRALGRKVKDGAYWSADEVKKGVDFLGSEIKKLGPGSLTQS